MNRYVQANGPRPGAEPGGSQIRNYILDKRKEKFNASQMHRVIDMATAQFTEPQFNDDHAAREHLEALRWPNGAVCPHCRGADRQSALSGESHRAGLYFCGHCRQQYTVTVGTVFERSKVPLHKWVLATHLICSSKKGISSHQLHRTLGVTYKTAWFMSHRIREAMAPIDGGEIMGGGGSIVVADETFVGRKRLMEGRRGPQKKQAIFAMVERDGGVRSFHVPDVTAATLNEKLREHVAKDTRLITDGGGQYHRIHQKFDSHETVNHRQGEYARGDVHTNTVEGYFSFFKRGLFGTYQYVSTKHLQRDTTEFDVRYNHRSRLGFSDAQRADVALRSPGGKRLVYSHTS